MADTMASDTEPSALRNAEQSAVVPEVSSPTPRFPPSRTSPSSCENSAPSDTSTRTTSTETTNKPQPPTKTVESVRRKVVDVAMEAGPRVVSGVWLSYRKFDKPVNKKGQNTQCQVRASPESEICGRLYKHQSGNGTAPLLDHLKHHHPEEYKLAIASSSKSKEAKAKKGDAYASAAGSSFFGAYRRKPLSPQLKARLDRLSVIWCVRDGQPFGALKDVGHKLLLSEFAPEYAASDISHGTLDKILSSLYDDAKAALVTKLKRARDALSKMGYSGPFCCLQLDMTSVSIDEFCTASVSVIMPGKQTLPVHLNLATKVFRGKHTKITIKRWIEELTTDVFGSFIPDVKPHQVYVAATVDQGRKIINACEALKIPTLECLCHRINSAVMWATGINGTAATCANSNGRELIGRYAALVGMFSHSCTNSDAFLALQDSMKQREAERMEQFRIEATDIEESSEAATATISESGLPKSLTFITRNDTRWTSLFGFLERLGILEDVVVEFLKTRPDMTHRGLSSEEWKVLKELCCVLEPLKIVVTKIQGGIEGLLSRAIYLCHDVHAMLQENELETIDWVTRRKLGDKADPGPVIATYEMTEVVKTALNVIHSQFLRRRIGFPSADVELLALFFDPRTKMLGENICGGADCRKRAEQALEKITDKLQEQIAAGEPVAAPETASSTEPPPKRRAVAGNAYERRQRRLEEEAASAVQAASGTNRPSVKRRVSKEIDEYWQLPAVANKKDFDVLGYWHDAGSARLDPHGNVIAAPQFPILSMLARVYLCIDSTSCQSEREFSSLAFVHSNLRRRTTPEHVEKMMFLRTNPNLIPEIKKLEDFLADISHERLEGKAKVVAAQKSAAGKEVKVEVDD